MYDVEQIDLSGPQRSHHSRFFSFFTEIPNIHGSPGGKGAGHAVTVGTMLTFQTLLLLHFEFVIGVDQSQSLPNNTVPNIRETPPHRGWDRSRKSTWVDSAQNYLILQMLAIFLYHPCDADDSMYHLRLPPAPRATSQIVPAATPVQDAFLVADDILRQGVVGISEIIIKPGLVNVDFADVRCDVW